MNTSSRIQRILVVAMLAAPAGKIFAQTASATTASVPAATSITTAQATKAAERKLAHRVANALARTHGLNPSRILVKAHGSIVTLSGSVTDGAQIPLALDAAKQVDGVSHIENRIRIAGASL